MTPLPGSNTVLPGASLLPNQSLHVHSVMLSAVAGFVDAAGFTALIGLFPAHLTGELVGDAIVLATGQRGHAMHLWMLPVFVCAVVSASLASRLLRRAGFRPLAGLLALVTIALGLFCVSGPLAHALHLKPGLALFIGGGCAVTAMGFQSALMRESLRASYPTTVMTGNLTQVIIELSDRAFAPFLEPNPCDRRPKSRLRPVATALVAFVASAALGGFLAHRFGSECAALPALVTATLARWAWREDQARLAQLAPISHLPKARLPNFETQHVWPDSLMPRSSEPSSEAHASSEAHGTSLTLMRAGQAIPPPSNEPRRAAARPQEKRTISGTQIAQRFSDEELEAFLRANGRK